MAGRRGHLSTGLELSFGLGDIEGPSPSVALSCLQGVGNECQVGGWAPQAPVNALETRPPPTEGPDHSCRPAARALQGGPEMETGPASRLPSGGEALAPLGPLGAYPRIQGPDDLT